jgi:peptidoglycan/xylan/chitin deacetylase (PgdA/CDA1 family)
MGGLVAVAAVQWVPSVVSLGQWSRARALPGRWCTWRAPASVGRAVALTFDDGPSPEHTPVQQDRLDQLGLRASFFATGRHVADHPELVAEVAARGHTVGTHGWGHGHHLLHGPRWVEAEVTRSVEVLAAAGVTPRWYRPPYGQLSGPSLLAARRHDLEVVLWSVWGREWTGADPARVAARVTASLAPGAVVLLHDSDAFSPPGSAAKVLAALGPIAEGLDRLGLRTATLDELMGDPTKRADQL